MSEQKHVVIISRVINIIVINVICTYKESDKILNEMQSSMLEMIQCNLYNSQFTQLLITNRNNKQIHKNMKIIHRQCWTKNKHKHWQL